MVARVDKFIVAGEMAIPCTRMENRLSFLVDINNEFIGKRFEVDKVGLR
jgi:hypothetical protein